MLENAKAYDQLSAHIKAYHELLEGRRIDPAVRANIKVQIELLMAASLRARALDQLALSHYQQAISLIEACPSPRLSSGVLAGLLLTVGKFHEAQRHFAKAQACYERSVVAAESATGKHDLLAALGGLALLSVRQGRHAEAVALYRRRVALIESDPKLGESAKIFANNQLAAALVATGDKSSGWQLFDQTVAAISRGRPPNQALMAATLLARIDAGLAELSDDTLWQDVRALTKSTALSIMHCRSLLRLAERAIDADRTKLAADIAAAVSDRSLDVAASNPAQAAPLFLNLACAVQRLGGDPRTAFDLLHHCVRTMAEFAGSTDEGGVFVGKVVEQIIVVPPRQQAGQRGDPTADIQHAKTTAIFEHQIAVHFIEDHALGRGRAQPPMTGECIGAGAFPLAQQGRDPIRL